MRYQLELALSARGAGLLLSCCMLAAFVVFVPLARLLRWNPVWTLLALLALAPILTFTLPTDAIGPPSGTEGRILGYLASFTDPASFDADLRSGDWDDESVANLLLFVPAGLFGTLACRSGVLAALGGVVLSFTIEGWQALSDVRVASAVDWLFNSAGAAAGAAAGMVLLAIARLAAPRPPAPAPAVPLSPLPRSSQGRAAVLYEPVRGHRWGEVTAPDVRSV